jgi:hypothetical protein
MKNRSELYPYSNGEKFKGKHAAVIFSEIMTNEIWEEKESLSGYGSSLVQTQELIKELPIVFQKYNIRKLLDAPCGDFNWMQKIDFTNINYTGGDIVKELIEINKNKYSRKNISFMQMDLMEKIVGEYDMLFCRDCLVHLSFEDILKVLENIKESQSKYLMTTTFPGEPENKNIVTGGWRPLNFLLPPFNFPKPTFLLNEKCTEMDGVFVDKSLGLWEVSQLP